MPAFAAIPIDKTVLEKCSKEELIELLLLALKAQEDTTRNMAAMNDLLTAADAKMRQLTDQNSTQEAELILLRNTVI